MQKNLTVKHANTLYGIAVVGMITIFFIAYLITKGMDGVAESITSSTLFINGVVEVLCFILPVFIFLKAKRMSIKSILRFNKLPIIQILLIIGMAIFAYPVIAFVTSLIQFLFAQTGIDFTGIDVPMPETSVELMLSFVAVGLIPAFAEEILFRGVLLRGYEHIGRKAALFIPALLFALLHGKIIALPYTFALGLFIGYLVLTTNSLWAGIVYHLMNNILGVGLLAFANWMRGSLPQDAVALLAEDSVTSEMLVPLGIIALVFAGLFLACLTLFRAHVRKRQEAQALSREPAPMIEEPKNPLDAQMGTSMIWLIAGVFVSVSILLADIVTAVFGISG